MGSAHRLRHTHSQQRGLSPRSPRACTVQLVSSPCATRAAACRSAIATDSGANSGANRGRLSAKVPGAMSRPCADSIRDTARNGRWCAYFSSRNSAQTLTPYGVFGNSRGAAGPNVSRRGAHAHAARRRTRRTRRTCARTSTSISSVVVAPFATYARPQRGQLRSDGSSVSSTAASAARGVRPCDAVPACRPRDRPVRDAAPRTLPRAPRRRSLRRP